MFTQCSTCETVFRLSAEALRAAGGQVRCGRCGEVFNALSRLAEDASGFTTGTGKSSLEEETRADEILESLGVSAEFIEVDDVPPGVEIARLELLEPLEFTPPPGVNEASPEFTLPPDVNEASLEFTLRPGELDRIFVETRSNPLQPLAADAPRGERAGVVQLHPEWVTAPDVPAEASLDVPVKVPTEASLEVPVRAPAEAAVDVPPAGPAPLTRIAGLEVSDDVREAMMSSFTHSKLPQMQQRRPPLPFSVWMTAAIVLGLLLLIQIVRGNSGWLAHASLLGGSASPSATLAAYQLRQWGVTGDPDAKGVLKVRASIMNTAAQLQPYPLLRVSLVDRFGTRVGAREFEPAEYLGKASARMLAPGERTDATLDILDPGKDAEGFEIDVCIRGADKAIYCAADAPGPAK